MITHIASVPISVRDQGRSLDFYVNALGCEKRADAPMGPEARWLTVAPRGAQTETILTVPAVINPEHGLNVEALIGSFTGIVFTTDDIEKDHAEFVDPDGNAFVLVQTHRM